MFVVREAKPKTPRSGDGNDVPTATPPAKTPSEPSGRCCSTERGSAAGASALRCLIRHAVAPSTGSPLALIPGLRRPAPASTPDVRLPGWRQGSRRLAGASSSSDRPRESTAVRGTWNRTCAFPPAPRSLRLETRAPDGVRAPFADTGRTSSSSSSSGSCTKASVLYCEWLRWTVPALPRAVYTVLLSGGTSCPATHPPPSNTVQS